MLQWLTLKLLECVDFEDMRTLKIIKCLAWHKGYKFAFLCIWTHCRNIQYERLYNTWLSNQNCNKFVRNVHFKLAPFSKPYKHLINMSLISNGIAILTIMHNDKIFQLLQLLDQLIVSWFCLRGCQIYGIISKTQNFPCSLYILVVPCLFHR